ncbi:sensor histidine kinase, partial [Peribacillus sp. NPDC056705]|uniref:sensor histidine kinase n=1 Tax=Peribacillus sp. NPDC056705 TaxID=3345918 RepID=UPI00374A138C
PEDWQVEMERVDLVALTKSSTKAFHDAYNRQIELKAEAMMLGWTDSRRLKQLLFILLDNALKYSDESIVIKVVRQQSEIHVQITDRGIGIPRDELERVFDRFYRVDEARSRRGGGAGLGLSLALDIAQAISAQIELDSLPGAGTTATIRIQAAP